MALIPSLKNSGNPHFWLRLGTPALALAPMEGVIDAPMRSFLSERCGFDWCVSEFIRVSQDPTPPKLFYRHVPELRSGAQTGGGTPVPVHVQLLGGDPSLMAESARRAIECGARGIDLNFGCPAPTVNRHDGGASLLRHPERIRAIVQAVRAAVPAEFPVAAKLRLGWDDPGQVHLNAEMAAQGGASWLTIHGRTKVQGYAPPVLWKPIGEVRRRLGEGSGGIPIVANGEIWNVADLVRCREETGCEHFMIGRGVLADLSLPAMVSRELGISRRDSHSIERSIGISVASWAPELQRFAEIGQRISDGSPGYTLRRMKQWLNMADRRVTLPWFHVLKKAQTLEQFFERLEELTRSEAVV